MLKTKKAAMEMSVGTIVTIVLLMSVLVLGLVLVQNIFSSAKNAIDLTDDELQSEINSMFAQKDNQRVVIYPGSREISLSQGELGEYSISIRNTDYEDATFSYEVKSADVSRNCNINERTALNYITSGREIEDIKIGSGRLMDMPQRIRMSIPEDAPLCDDIAYQVDILKDEETYVSTFSIHLQITSGGLV